MSAPSRLVLASANPGNLRECRRLLSPLGIDLIGQADLCIAEADEPHATFIENALAKARQASAVTSLPALADDSGICVDATVVVLQGVVPFSPILPASRIGARTTIACWCYCAAATIPSRSWPRVGGTGRS